MPTKNPLQVFKPEVDPGEWIKLDNWDVSLFLDKNELDRLRGDD